MFSNAPVATHQLHSSYEMEAPGPLGALRGTAVLPAEKGAPVILIIPGSGPTDRDGNSPLGIRAATYKLLAEGLAAQGVASIRIDKRGMFGSQAAVPDANAVTVNDYVDDISAWVNVAMAQTGASCIWLLGHSEGGLVALVAVGKIKNICGLVLLATPARPLGEVLAAQLRSNPHNAPLMDTAVNVINQLSAGHRVDAQNIPPLLMPLFKPAVQGFLISAFSLNPIKLAGKVDKPVLILQGERDIQVPATAEQLRQVFPQATLAMLPDTNHIFKPVTTDDKAVNLATYTMADLPLAPGVVSAITDFVKSHGSSK